MYELPSICRTVSATSLLGVWLESIGDHICAASRSRVVDSDRWRIGRCFGSSMACFVALCFTFRTRWCWASFYALFRPSNVVSHLDFPCFVGTRCWCRMRLNMTCQIAFVNCGTGMNCSMRKFHWILMSSDNGYSQDLSPAVHAS